MPHHAPTANQLHPVSYADKNAGGAHHALPLTLADGPDRNKIVMGR